MSFTLVLFKMLLFRLKKTNKADVIDSVYWSFFLTVFLKYSNKYFHHYHHHHNKSCISNKSNGLMAIPVVDNTYIPRDSEEHIHRVIIE